MAAIIDSTAVEDEGGDLILWILVWSELAAFGVLLGGFLVMSFLHPEDFGVAKLHMDTRLASLNTLVLLASGWRAAAAVRANTELGRKIGLWSAAFLGLVFAAIKAWEYRGDLHFAGEASFNAFFELYFLITGFHLAHVVFLSLIMLLVARRPQPGNVALVATLWHAVDLVWLVIFPIVYLG
ncbi:nitric oxide reductase NorE protein [Rhizobium sp. SG_E_25_P2]|uniref:cytochrome c oxidase subunit 3 n=1 Tax=Rhizobium sp. SG_E_25_P2 TaxID=2879942 RepID=UPI0024770874|nr:cytochrome c oxidase subunit 3 [Rhizobium sp. SG_E_25_P2]MDH6268193.1 nitric oxide reductase NorE protein [Rhizobium sp. SG_E_25_P2]